MHCDDYAPLIGELIDGSAAPGAARDARAHLETCAACQALAEDLTRLRGVARTLEAPPLPAHLWPRIADALQRERELMHGREPDPAAVRRDDAAPVTVRPVENIASRRRDSSDQFPVWAWLPAAAALLLVAGGLSWVGGRLTPASGPAVAAGLTDGVDGEDEAGGSVDPEATEELQLAEAAFADAIAGLEAATRAEAPAAAAGDWLDGVADLDAAIDESREAARTAPDSLRAQERLLDALRTKMALLQDTVALMDETGVDGTGGLTPGAASDRELLQ